MIDSGLQKAMYGAITAGGSRRCYDQVPAGAEFPYFTIGDEQVIDAGNSCDDAWEVFADVHVWSRPDSGSKAELKDLMAEVVPLLATTSLLVPGFVIIAATLESSRTFRDPDGLTEHGVLAFRYLIDPA